MFYSILLNEKHPSYDRDDRTYKILFAKDDIMRQTKYLKKKKKLHIKQCHHIVCCLEKTVKNPRGCKEK